MTNVTPLPPALERRLRFLPSFLFRPEAAGSYILKAWPLVLVPSLALSWLVSLAAPAAEGPAISVESWTLVAMLVIGAPLIETIIMLPPLLILNRLFGPTVAVVLSAAGWAAAHSSAAWIWGLVVWWPFLIFSIALLVWRERSLMTGFLVVACVHALQNGFGAALLLLLPEQGAAPAS